MKSPFSSLAARLTIGAVCLFFCAGLVSAQSLPGHRAPDKTQPKESVQTKAARGQAPLRKLYDYLRPDPAKTKRLPKLHSSEKESKAMNKALQIGAVRSLPEPIKNTSDGTAYRLPDGDVRVVSIVSPGALYTRVQFTEMDLPVGARVFVYSMANTDEFYGPYEGRGPSEDGTFWTPPMKGDSVVIEYFAPATAASGTRFNVSRISHVYQDPTTSNVEACHNDVSDPWTETAKAVGRLDFVSGGGVFICTGTLIADDVPSTNIPYLLTAGHCFDTQTEAQSLRVWWNYLTDNNPPASQPPAGTPFTDGANLLVTGLESDFTFVRLIGALPGGLFFSGWDASNFVGSSDGTGIHHPDGAYKRISFGTARQPAGGECPQGLQCFFVDWNRTANPGVTEPGSSGSGLWQGLPADAGGAKLIGTLTGGTSACGAPPASQKDFYARFSVTYPHIASYLTGAPAICPASPITVGQTINGELVINDCDHQHRGGSVADLYTFSGSTGQQVAVSMTASFDTYLYLIGPSGTIVAWNDDSGGTLNSRIPQGSTSFFTLPASGTYTIEATSFDPNVTGPYTLMLFAPAQRTLTVASQNPSSGISVNASPSDNNGTNSGTTQFTLTYNQNTNVFVSAPSTAGPNTVFVKWLRDGADFTTSNSTFITMDVDHTMTAVYGPTPTYVLTVASENPSSGVPMTLTPNDNGGQGNGTTEFTRTYTQFTTVTLTAPISVAGNYFQKWRRNDGTETTSRATTVNMGFHRTMTAVYVTVPPLPTPSPTPTPSGPGQAVTYQINPAHTGSQHDSTIPPLAQRWSRDLGQTVSYPLIAGGRVFVTTVTGLHALDATNGATLWTTGDIGTSPAAAYDAGRVFVINRTGLLRAFDASTGTQVWTRLLGGQQFTSPPTAVGGTVYVNGYATLHAVNEQDGTVKWSVNNAGGDHSSPAVSADGVYVSHSCNNTWGLSPATGSVLWHYTTSCFGGGGKTPVLYAGRLYDRAGDHLVLHGSAGVPVATFSSLQAPAFNGATGYFKSGSTLEARDVVSGTLKWSFTGDGTLSSAPIVVNGFVYIGSTSGKLYAVSESSGASIWTGNPGAPVIAPDEQSASAPAGLAAGEGLIVVPASSLLVAYHSSPQLITDSNNRVVAMESVTFLRDPFRLTAGHNFSLDQRTRITFFTSNLGITQPSADLSVLAANIPLTVEAVGTLAGQPQYSYITVKLDPALPTGVDVQLSVIFRGTTTNAGVITIAP